MKGTTAACLFAFLILMSFSTCSASSVTRSFSAASIYPDTEITVGLSVSITSGERFYAIDESYPSGWAVTNTTGDTSQARHIKYVVLNNASNTVYSYIIRCPTQEGTYAFSGVFMAENMSSETGILGDTQVTVSSGSSEPPSSPPPGGGGTPSFPSSYTCYNEWQCGDWAVCTNGFQSRECEFVSVPAYTLSTQCPTESNPPYETMRCSDITSGQIAENCNDGVRNQDEEGVDCGGVCKPCTGNSNFTSNASGNTSDITIEAGDEQFEATLRFIFYVVISFVILLVSIIVLSRLKHKQHGDAGKPSPKKKPEKRKEKEEAKKEAVEAFRETKPEEAEAKEEEAAKEERKEGTGNERKYAEVVAYIEDLRSKGYDDSRIESALLGAGWKSDIVKELMKKR